MKIKCLYDKMLPIGEVKPNPRNVNQHPDIQIKGLAVTLQENEIRHPLIISKLTGYLVAGHARLEVFKKLGIIEVPVVYQDFESEEKEFQFMVSDNESQRRSWLDPEKFDTNVGELKMEKIDEKAFGIFTDYGIKKGKTGEDRAETVPERPPRSNSSESEESEEPHEEQMSGEGESADDLSHEEEQGDKDETFSVKLVYDMDEYKKFLSFIDKERERKDDNQLPISKIILNTINEVEQFRETS